MRVYAFLVGAVIGLGMPIFLFGLTICLLSLVDVQARIFGYGQD